MIERLNTEDWKEAFGYAGEEGTEAGGGNKPNAVLGDTVSTAPFCREDVKNIIALSEGEKDETPWLIACELNDGRFAYLEAGCDYTGWD
jgi:hypothetical protein